MDKYDLAEHMKSIDSGGHEPKKVPPPNENPPDGNYIAKIMGGRFQEKRDGSALMFIFSFEILEGDYKQWSIDKWHTPLRMFVSGIWEDNKDKLDKFIKDLHIIKSCPEKWVDLLDPDKLDAMIGLVVELGLHTIKFDDGGSMQFTNLIGLVKPGHDAGAPKGDDVPF